MCGSCESSEPFIPSPYFTKMFFLYQLSMGGYPFRSNDMEVQDWIALGELKMALEAPVPDARGK
jgi:hypothetical protein